MVGSGRMTAGEKRALVNWYLTWGPKGAGLTKRRAAVDKAYPYALRDVEKLVARGLLEAEIGRMGEVILDMTPQGVAVARMILGLTRPKRRRRK